MNSAAIDRATPPREKFLSTSGSGGWYVGVKVKVKRPLRFRPGSLLAGCLRDSWSAACVGLPADGLPRERGALYLEDFLDQPYRLKVLAPGPIYFNADQARFLGTMRAGQLVELQAVSENGALCRVRGQAMQGQVAGWIDARFLSPIDPGVRRRPAPQPRAPGARQARWSPRTRSPSA